jgi:RNA polymerase sigma factor (TIGR02999 family)
MPLVYDELRRLAASYLRNQVGGQSLQATALVHEAYVQLADQRAVSMQHRAQFFDLAAKVMRDILVDHARKRLAAKRGGDVAPLGKGGIDEVYLARASRGQARKKKLAPMPHEL